MNVCALLLSYFSSSLAPVLFFSSLLLLLSLSLPSFSSSASSSRSPHLQRHIPRPGDERLMLEEEQATRGDHDVDEVYLSLLQVSR